MACVAFFSCRYVGCLTLSHIAHPVIKHPKSHLILSKHQTSTHQNHHPNLHKLTLVPNTSQATKINTTTPISNPTPLKNMDQLDPENLILIPSDRKFNKPSLKTSNSKTPLLKKKPLVPFYPNESTTSPTSQRAPTKPTPPQASHRQFSKEEERRGESDKYCQRDQILLTRLQHHAFGSKGRLKGEARWWQLTQPEIDKNSISTGIARSER